MWSEHESQTALIDIACVVGQESHHLGVVEGWQTGRHPLRLDLPHLAANRAPAVGEGAKPVAAAVETAKPLADGIGWAVVVDGDAAGVATTGAGGIDVATTLAGLGGGEDGGDGKEGGLELHFGRVLICKREF